MPAQPHVTVLHYTGAHDDRGGIMAAVRALAESGRWACVLGVSAGFAARRPLSLPVLEWPALEAERIGPGTWWRARRVAHELRRWLAQDPTRMVHAHTRAGLLVALHLAAAGEKRVVASVHCCGRQRWFYRHAARRLGPRLFWLTPAMKRHYGCAGPDWTQCIPSGISAGSEVPPRHRLPDTGELRLGGIGLLVRWKGWHLVLEALGLLPPEVRRRVTFEHIGAPDVTRESQAYAAELRSRTAALGLTDRVRWRGEETDSSALLADVDCLVVSSRNEPLSLALLEALRAGVPVLAADSGGPTDVLREAETGWFFRTGSARDLARAIAALVTTDRLGRVRITPECIRRFTTPVVAAEWAEVYARLT